MLRLPASRIDLQQWKPYFPGGPATLTEMEDHVVIELWWDAEEPDDEFEAGLLGVLTPLRAQLLQGDMSAAYLAWLLAVQAEEVTASTREPPVPYLPEHPGVVWEQALCRATGAPERKNPRSAGAMPLERARQCRV